MDSGSWSLSTTVSRFISAEELAKTSQSNLGDFASPVLKVKGESRRYFDSVAVPITNENWRARWKGMCVSQSENILDGMDDDGDQGSTKKKDEERALEELAEEWRASPSFLKEECNLTGLGELGGL